MKDLLLNIVKGIGCVLLSCWMLAIAFIACALIVYSCKLAWDCMVLLFQ